MKADELLDSLEHVDPELVAQADKPPQKAPHRRPLWMGLTAVAAAAAIVIGIVLWPGGSPLTGQASALAVAEYPDMAPYPNEMDYLNPDGSLDSDRWSADYDTWRTSQKAQLNQPEGYDSGLEGYYTATLRQFLGDSGTENKVCSPLNIYFALGMLADLTDGSSRQQILDLLGQDSIDTLRAQARALWNANYSDDGMLTSVLASSLWLNEDVPFNQSTLDTLADTYYASSYQGEMGSAELDQALQTWLNDQTGGLLKEAAGQVRLDPETVLALAKIHPNIVGMKDTVAGMDHTRELIKVVKSHIPQFEIYSGFDDNFAHNVLSGGDGCIGALSNVVPEVCAAWVRAFRENDLAGIAKGQQIIDRLMDLYTVRSPFLPVIKEACRLRGIAATSVGTFPMPSATVEDDARILELLNREGIQ